MSQKNKLKRFAQITDMNHVLEFPENIKGNWSKEFFKNDKPIVLELACGGGEYTVALGERFPEKNFIGVDIKGNRIFKGAKQALDKGLDNVGFLRIYIEHLMGYFAENEVDEIWITFPDPQPRPAKAKKRLSSPRFLEFYQYIMKEGGSVNFKTDNPPLFQFSVDSAKEFGCKLETEIWDVYAPEVTDPLLHIQTHYEKMHLKNDLKIHFLKFRF